MFYRPLYQFIFCNEKGPFFCSKTLPTLPIRIRTIYNFGNCHISDDFFIPGSFLVQTRLSPYLHMFGKKYVPQVVQVKPGNRIYLNSSSILTLWTILHIKEYCRVWRLLTTENIRRPQQSTKHISLLYLWTVGTLSHSHLFQIGDIWL